ncbi:MAG: excinuclease ABC subunit UvrA [Alphaproteobacteria bacterium]|nr:excinuclease ABC subunit UvrA [Alphaproteobacteria bacterium]
MDSQFIRVKGARAHNLKNISIDLPRNQLIVITGVSGSGKSSLAFDTLYAEGQRRYVESLSVYARQFLELVSKPDVDLIEGLSPAISIEQKTLVRNPRSTVGTITEIYDFMRLLWARVGVPYSPATGLPIESQTVPQMVDRIMALPEQTKLYLLAPMVVARKGEYKKDLQSWLQKGYSRVKIDGTLYEIEEAPALDKQKKHDIFLVVDRLSVHGGIEQRLAASLETAIKLADGRILVENITDQTSFWLSSKFACPESGFTLPELEPRLFSFNTPQGACPQCEGLGVKLTINPDLVVPDKTLSLNKGALAPWTSSSGELYAWHAFALKHLMQRFTVDPDVPWEKLPPQTQQAILYGKDGFEGVIPNMERRFLETQSDWMREEIGKYQDKTPCPACHGARLIPEALCVKVMGKTIFEATTMPIYKARQWFAQLKEQLSEKQAQIAARILQEIVERLTFLDDVGVGYLTLDRSAGTLSGGESQRIRLASQIGSGLTGVMYVLDEPSIGLHQRDNDRLLATLQHLKKLGNTVIVVEHDEDAMRSADYIVDMGPKAGRNGGYIVAQGTPAQLQANPASLTGQYLAGVQSIAIPTTRRKGNGQQLVLQGATLNNLKNVTASFPLGTLVCVTGVSGSGKSSLILDTLYKGVSQFLTRVRCQPGPFTKLSGVGYLDKVIDIDQTPIGRTPRSNPATYTGMFTPIREWFAALPEAKARGYQAGRFSFNVQGGRCEACQGDGILKIEMNFLPDVYVPCDQCHGKRYNRDTLDITYRGKSIADVLEMTVDEVCEFFAHVPTIRHKCEVLQDVGLGYIQLGQSATTLSGGEAQRLKLAKELSRTATGKTLYILDEPTTGLHFDDVKQLLHVLNRLVDQGNTVIVIEHNLDVIKTADYIVDLGPDGGDNGGQIIVSGTPEEVARCPQSYTGQYLAHLLSLD